MKIATLFLLSIIATLGSVQTVAAEEPQAAQKADSPSEATPSAPAVPKVEEAPKNQATSPNKSAASRSQTSYLRPSSPKTSDAAPPQALGTKSDPSLVRVILALLVVAGLGGIALYAKRRKGGGHAMLRERVRLHSIGTLQLGPKSQIALISVGREAILLGVSEQGISCLRSFREEELGSLTTRETSPPAQARIETDAEDAFNDLLVRAAKSDATKPASAPKQAIAGAKLPLDEFTPTGFKDESAVPEADLEEPIPPHLAQLLQESETSQRRELPSNVQPLRPGPSAYVQGNRFAEPEGQAAELMRRFSELGQ